MSILVNSLKACFRALFYGPPEVGTVYVFDEWDTSNPFKKHKPWKVEVLAVKNGWVNYRGLHIRALQNESSKADSFNFCYKKVNEKSP